MKRRKKGEKKRILGKYLWSLPGTDQDVLAGSRISNPRIGGEQDSNRKCVYTLQPPNGEFICLQNQLVYPPVYSITSIVANWLSVQSETSRPLVTLSDLLSTTQCAFIRCRLHSLLRILPLWWINKLHSWFHNLTALANTCFCSAEQQQVSTIPGLSFTGTWLPDDLTDI